ncbi:hypothetical protein [Thermus scotoductus]|nr:hypothetical protein [Thermus scotoductus]
MRALYWTLGLSWVAFLAFYLQGGRVGSPAYLAFGFLYMWIPGLVALSFARKEGVRLPLALRPNRYWLFAWLFPVALTLLSIPLSLPFGAWKGWEALRQTAPQEAAQAIPETLSALFPLVLILSALVAGATVNLLAALGEELLWRGYLWEKVTTPRTKVRGFSGFPPKAPSGPRKTLTPYRQASAMLLALPRVFVWSFTHRTTRWNPLLQVSRSTGNFVPKNIVPNPCPPVVDVGELSSLRSHVAARYAARYAARDR